MSEKTATFVPQFRIPRFFTFDLWFKLGSMVFAFFATYLINSLYIQPTVEDLTVKGRVEARLTEGYVASRSPAVIMKDPEQLCEIAFWIWAIIMLSHKMWRLSRENRMLGLDYVGLRAGEQIYPEDAARRLRDIDQALGENPSWRDRLLPNIILSALHRFHATGGIGDVAGTVKERADATANEYEADLALIRFIAWVIPAIGFIGTVRGIGEALSQAQKAIAGDITGVVDALGLAFNSTLVALLLAIPLMFMLFMVQGRQDKFFVDLLAYCDAHLISRLKGASAPETEKSWAAPTAS
ncbi:MAG: MotA/TolQ/ExbB proton channel family protein [Opitutaceae bacterium]|nr:MotA/TolQ/ExbB proton channel family protein [Opitutaceae bacterium]